MLGGGGSTAVTSGFGSASVGGDGSSVETAGDDVRPSRTVTSPISVCLHTHAHQHTRCNALTLQTTSAKIFLQQ